IGGIVGALGTGIFTAPWLGGTGGDDFSIASQLWIQIVAVVVTILWCGILSAILYKIVDAVFGLRPSPEDETQGLDLTSHGEAAYHYAGNRGIARRTAEDAIWGLALCRASF